MSAEIPMIDMIKTGQNIKRLRETRCISVKNLQDALGFTNPQAIYKWQRGESLPTIDNLVVLASMLGTTIDEIIVTE